jgi:hypothetical protein
LNAGFIGATKQDASLVNLIKSIVKPSLSQATLT